MNTTIPVLPRVNETLADGLTMRTPAGLDDVERVATFASTVFGPEVGPMMRTLLARHPSMTWDDQSFVENEAGEVVSALCLIPWTWRYGRAELAVGEMGVVATAVDYRRRGLVRRQVDFFKERLAERGCVLSIIQGIPFYYRQFGYDYALPLEGGWRLELRQAPSTPETGHNLRRATLDDLPSLQSLYARAVRSLTIHAVRTPEIWRYLLEPYMTPVADSRQTWAVCAADGAVAGYARLPEFHFGAELVVDEASLVSADAGLALLAHLRRQAEAAGRPFIRLNLPGSNDLVQLARSFGAVSEGTYSWQLYVPDMAALLRAIGPTLEDRLAASLYAGLTREVRIHFYRAGLALRFEQGRLQEVAALEGQGQADLSLPLWAFVPLVLGHRTLDELHFAYPDTSWHGGVRLLLETLFPRSEAFLYTVY
ncbi:MAG: GNAT family N-acetyltransferase [Caldilineaceae bacterium]|nr:GNAT family N-acetyltransferase [Caldilineaceae bacterium]